jgi:hypothetical protein
MAAAGETIDMIIDVEADELAMDIPFDPNIVIIDVRKGSGIWKWPYQRCLEYSAK